MNALGGQHACEMLLMSCNLVSHSETTGGDDGIMTRHFIKVIFIGKVCGGNVAASRAAGSVPVQHPVAEFAELVEASVEHPVPLDAAPGGTAIVQLVGASVEHPVTLDRVALRHQNRSKALEISQGSGQDGQMGHGRNARFVEH